MNIKRNIVEKWHDLRDGTIVRQSERMKALNEILMKSSFLTNMSLTHTYEHVLNKMLSSLEWHPNSNLLVIGSRGGDVSCLDLNSRSVRHCSRGKGRGQQITDIKFDLLDTNWFYTSSTSGKLIKQRLDGREDIILKDSYDSEEFYSRARFSCLDVCSDRKVIISGDSRGYIHLCPSTQTNSCKDRNGLSLHIHNSNLLHCEFNKLQTNLFITASIDCTAKLYDLRMISHMCSKPVLTIRQSRPLNSATFSLTNGSTLLLTNSFDEISVYRGPDWQLERCIKQSHEQTQRFCLLKAKWHPLSDLFIIGSFSSNPLVSGQYCDKPQAMDVIDAKSGQIKSSLCDGNPGVLSNGCFNSTGDMIAAIKGQNIFVFQSMAKD